MKFNQKHLARIVQRMRGHAVGVFGDFMFDEFLRGEATRISPEAPVPVLLIKDENSREGFAGGAGNVAVNIRALGGKPIPFGAIGDDETGKRLKSLLSKRGIAHRTLVEERGRVTPRKVRVAAHQHQLLRLDFERPAPLSAHSQAALGKSLGGWIPRLKALAISDYSKGSVSIELATSAISMARQRRIPVFVDAKANRPEICRHATLVKKNLHEAELMAGHSMRNRDDLEAGGRRLLGELDCSCLLVTRGGEGMTLFETDGPVHNIPGIVRPVYDVTGAGDTVLAVLALAVAGGASMSEAAWIANRAGGRVVLKFGTAEIQPAELLEALQAGD